MFLFFCLVLFTRVVWLKSTSTSTSTVAIPYANVCACGRSMCGIIRRWWWGLFSFVLFCFVLFCSGGWGGWRGASNDRDARYVRGGWEDSGDLWGCGGVLVCRLSLRRGGKEASRWS